MGDNSCTITVNGVDLEATPGEMLIAVTDRAGIYVPRFCYHAKLSIAANCRMCLVEVENAPKPMPACATPVTPGMKVQTRSARAIGAQRATMEFLLINHPLDCPICDQGGECELQDLAMGFGRDISRYAERKRVVRDKNIGPLISTDMTRCIHCTRCVRFTEEIAGFQELGTIGRGDRLEISTYIERSVDHELSGNVIDLCPVGALNSKPFRFSARAWEMTEVPGIAGHDCLGSHLYAHVMGGSVKRVVPRLEEAVNESWLSDRDRFSYEGVYAPDRLEEPMLRTTDGWRSVSWDEALDAAATGLQAAAGDGLGALVSPNATTEEGYLVARLMSHLGSASVDYRLRRRDFRTQDQDPVFPWLGMEIVAVERLDSMLFVGAHIRQEVPLLAHRVRKAALRGARVSFVNPAAYPILFPAAPAFVGAPADFWLELARLVRAAGTAGSRPAGEAAAIASRGPEPGDAHRQVVESLRASEHAAIFLGQVSMRHPAFGEIEILAHELARLTGAALGYVPEGANAAGLSLAGVLPHREAGGGPRPAAGETAAGMVQGKARALLLFGIEPRLDCARGEVLGGPRAGERFIVACTPYGSGELMEIADVLLPVGTWFETPGTFVNVEGRWQSFGAAAAPVGSARPGWKVLRVLGNRLGVPAFEFQTVTAVRDELRDRIGDIRPDNLTRSWRPPGRAAQLSVNLDDIDVPMYQVDALVRRASALQQTFAGGAASPDVPRRRRA